MFRLFMNFIDEEDGIGEYVCEMCGLIHESLEEKLECYHSCIAKVDERMDIACFKVDKV